MGSLFSIAGSLIATTTTAAIVIGLHILNHEKDCKSMKNDPHAAWYDKNNKFYLCGAYCNTKSLQNLPCGATVNSYGNPWGACKDKNNCTMDETNYCFNNLNNARDYVADNFSDNCECVASDSGIPIVGPLGNYGITDNQPNPDPTSIKNANCLTPWVYPVYKYCTESNKCIKQSNPMKASDIDGITYFDSESVCEKHTKHHSAPTRWICNGGYCEPAPDGALKENCEKTCGAKPGVICQNNTCMHVDDTRGASKTYSTIHACSHDIDNPCHGKVPGYICNQPYDSDHGCHPVSDITGMAHAYGINHLDLCKQECKGPDPIPPKRYTCNNYGTCVETKGHGTSFAECQTAKNCPKDGWVCNAEMDVIHCQAKPRYEQAKGTKIYDTFAQCNEATDGCPPPNDAWVCGWPYPNEGCQFTHDKSKVPKSHKLFNNAPACHATECHPSPSRWNCEPKLGNGTCVQADNGKYSSQSECEKEPCYNPSREFYSCDHNTGVCVETPGTGNSPEECKKICHKYIPPLPPAPHPQPERNYTCGTSGNEYGGCMPYVPGTTRTRYTLAECYANCKAKDGKLVPKLYACDNEKTCNLAAAGAGTDLITCMREQKGTCRMPPKKIIPTPISTNAKAALGFDTQTYFLVPYAPKETMPYPVITPQNIAVSNVYGIYNFRNWQFNSLAEILYADHYNKIKQVNDVFNQLKDTIETYFIGGHNRFLVTMTWGTGTSTGRPNGSNVYYNLSNTPATTIPEKYNLDKYGNSGLNQVFSVFGPFWTDPKYTFKTLFVDTEMIHRIQLDLLVLAWDNYFVPTPPPPKFSTNPTEAHILVCIYQYYQINQEMTSISPKTLSVSQCITAILNRIKEGVDFVNRVNLARAKSNPTYEPLDLVLPLQADNKGNYFTAPGASGLLKDASDWVTKKYKAATRNVWTETNNPIRKYLSTTSLLHEGQIYAGQTIYPLLWNSLAQGEGPVKPTDKMKPAGTQSYLKTLDTKLTNITTDIKKINTNNPILPLISEMGWERECSSGAVAGDLPNNKWIGSQASPEGQAQFFEYFLDNENITTTEMNGFQLSSANSKIPRYYWCLSKDQTMGSCNLDPANRPKYSISGNPAKTYDGFDGSGYGLMDNMGKFLITLPCGECPDAILNYSELFKNKLSASNDYNINYFNNSSTPLYGMLTQGISASEGIIKDSSIIPPNKIWQTAVNPPFRAGNLRIFKEYPGPGWNNIGGSSNDFKDARTQLQQSEFTFADKAISYDLSQVKAMNDPIYASVRDKDGNSLSDKSGCPIMYTGASDNCTLDTMLEGCPIQYDPYNKIPIPWLQDTLGQKSCGHLKNGGKQDNNYPSNWGSSDWCEPEKIKPNSTQCPGIDLYYAMAANKGNNMFVRYPADMVYGGKSEASCKTDGTSNSHARSLDFVHNPKCKDMAPATMAQLLSSVGVV